MKKNIALVPRLKLDDFAGCIQGQNFVKNHIKFPWGYNGFYADTIASLQNSLDNLPQSYVQDFYNIYFLDDGKIIKVNQTKKIRLKPKEVYISKPGQMKRWQQAENTKGYFLAFSKDYLKGLKYRKNMLLEFPFLLPNQEVIFSITKKEQKNLLNLSKKIYQCFSNKDHYSYDLIQLNILEILIILKRHCSKNRHIVKKYAFDIEDDLTQRFLVALESHFIKGLQESFISNKGVQRFADDMNVHIKSLNMHVKETLGKSPKTIITERYILAAKCKLIHTDIPVSEICYILGFDNPSYFSRFFKKSVGMSPNSFRSNFQLSMN